jgi:hypothetical protein
MSESVRVQGNYVGADRGGTKDVGNAPDGLFLEIASGATIGGKTAVARNVISGNGGGVDLFSDEDTKVLGNRMGTTAGGTGALGNEEYGVFIQNPDGIVAANNRVGDSTAEGSNTIAFNGTDGVEIFSRLGEEVSRDSIFSNSGLGIDLLNLSENTSTNILTSNGAGDADTGPNDLQNKPVVSSARTGSLKITIKGNLDSNPNKNYIVEFYTNPAKTNEGKKFVGETTITTSVDGLRAFTFSPSAEVPVGRTITATATEVTSGFPHDTSEFSAPRTVASS